MGAKTTTTVEDGGGDRERMLDAAQISYYLNALLLIII